MIFMNKKGFTLVELLAVIVILGLLIAIISPVVKNLINDSENNLSEQQKKLVVEATKKYMIENSELLPEGSNRAIVYMSDLIDKGVIDNDKIIDPKSKGEINGCVVVSYNNEFNQYDYNYSDNENDCLITVTFDPEGGSVDTTSKQVKLNSTYGELPTPTREGYNFLGWSGKNMYSKDYTSVYNNDVSFQDNSIIFDKSNIEENRMNWIFLRAYKNGTLVLDGYGSTRTAGERYSKVLDLNGSYNFNRIGIKINTKKADGVLYIKNILDQSKKYTVSFNVDMLDFDHAKAIISDLQLEDGEVATEYEPFKQYSSDTVVTKASDHTLHAIWEIAS